MLINTAFGGIFLTAGLLTILLGYLLKKGIISLELLLTYILVFLYSLIVTAGISLIVVIVFSIPILI